MVIDTSALVAILLRESDAELYAQAIDRAPLRLLSAVSRVELAIVIESRKGEPGRLALERLLNEANIETAAVTPQQATAAIEAFRTYGKGRHKAALNIGDCFTYALAQTTGHPLLFKGNDFSHTNVPNALT